jgi:hypothetical protein
VSERGVVSAYANPYATKIIAKNDNTFLISYTDIKAIFMGAGQAENLNNIRGFAADIIQIMFRLSGIS